MFVTADTQVQADLLAEVADALRELGLEVRVGDEVVVVDGSRLVPYLVGRAHPTPADLAQLVEHGRGKVPAMVVADRISEAGRDVLRRAGWGWLDRRGHVRVWSPGVRVEAPLPATGVRRAQPGNAWTTVGLEIALAALIEPTEAVTARRVAAITGRSAGATHELIGRFGELGLIGRKTHRPLLPELFWETAAQWPDDGWVGLPVGLDEVAERIGGDELVRVDERAATLGGARIAAAGDLPSRCYVRSAPAMRRARALIDRDQRVHSWVRSTPVRWMPRNDQHPPDEVHPWHVAHPLVCALRLARDPARGREIVEDWGIVPDASGDEP
jgi:hypothetical protein